MPPSLQSRRTSGAIGSSLYGPDPEDEDRVEVVHVDR
jgi:hypothetical protein